LLQRIIGVYELDVDTAGSSKKEGKIKGFHSIGFSI
jgi:putative membrane protein